jgi:hypothetical protein
MVISGSRRNLNIVCHHLAGTPVFRIIQNLARNTKSNAEGMSQNKAALIPGAEKHYYPLGLILGKMGNVSDL